MCVAVGGDRRGTVGNLSGEMAFPVADALSTGMTAKSFLTLRETMRETDKSQQITAALFGKETWSAVKFCKPSCRLIHNGTARVDIRCSRRTVVWMRLE